jgi:Ca2+-binding RTX toxin-like protein
MATFNDTATDDTLMGGIGNDLLIGGIGIDNLSGGAGNDTLIAGSIISVTLNINITLEPIPPNFDEYDLIETDSLDFADLATNANIFVDNLNGGAGDDSLYSSYTAGNSILTGGLGADHFIFAGFASFTDAISITGDTWGSISYASLYDKYKALYSHYEGFATRDIPALSFSTVAAPDRITDFNAAEGDLIDLNGISGVIWRGAANAGFAAQIGQSMALAGSYLAGDEDNLLEFWTLYDSSDQKSILFVDSNHDFIVDTEDFRLEFNGNIPLNMASFTPGTFYLKFGTDGADNNTTLPLSADNDTAYGLAGDDKLDGLAGNDTIKGGTGNDSLTGGLGTDILYGGTGNDYLNGGLDADELYGEAGDDTLNGGLDADKLYGEVGDDTLNGDAGDDYLQGNSGQDTLNGGDGDDTLYSEGYSSLSGDSEDLAGSVNSLNGDAGDDYLWAGKGDDILNGGSGNDNLYGNDGSDKLNGGTGADYLTGWDGNDSLDGGTGADELRGGADNDILKGGADNDSLYGEDGSDNLNGDDGADLLDGGTGIDTLLGGLGNDAYYVDNLADIVTENSALATEIDTVNSTISYTLGANLENLALTGSAAINGTGNTLNNTLTGNDSANILTGGMGADKLIGGNGNDLFIGSKGKDIHLLAESVAATDTVRIAPGDSLINSFDVASGFKLGFGTTTKVGVDKLDLASNHIASNAAKVDGIDSGLIHSHSINKGLIQFDNINTYTAPLTLSAANLPYVFSYLQKNITTIGSTVEFNAQGNTYVFQDGGINDTLVQLTGVTANQISTTGLVNHALWLI